MWLPCTAEALDGLDDGDRCILDAGTVGQVRGDAQGHGARGVEHFER